VREESREVIIIKTAVSWPCMKGQGIVTYVLTAEEFATGIKMVNQAINILYRIEGLRWTLSN